MLKEAICHETVSEYAYALDKDTLVLKIKTAKNDLKKVNVLYEDKYKIIRKAVRMKKKEMGKICSDDLFDYYEIELPFNVISMTYYFELIDENEKLYYGNNKFFDARSNQTYMHFNVPVLAEEDIFRTASWLRGAIGYQIFPDRFAKKGGYEVGYSEDEKRLGKFKFKKEVSEWDVEPKWDSFTGGNLQGLISKLDYLDELGVNLLYLTPVFKAGTSHRYDTIDYYEIDPMLGTKEDFREFLAKAHSKGMRVVLDGVFNHSGYDFGPFQDLKENGADSKYKDWFTVESFPVREEPSPNYKTFAHFFGMPKLNLMNPETEEYVLGIMEYWIKEFDIDGWRLDVADEVSHEFWRKARKRIQAVKEDSILTGEIWYDSRAWLKGDQFDTVMNYIFYEACIDYVAKGKTDLEKIFERLAKVRGIYKKQAYKAMWNLIGSHDTPRFLSQAAGKKERQRLAVLIQMTVPGIPFIYYGDEIGMLGGRDPECRRAMKWNEMDKELLDYYKKLIKIRKSNDFFIDGEIRVLDYGEKIFAYEIYKGKKSIKIIVNLLKKKQNITLDKKYKNLMNKRVCEGELSLGSKEIVILK